MPSLRFSRSAAPLAAFLALASCDLLGPQDELRILPEDLRLVIGESLQLQAQRNGRDLSRFDPANWSSSDPSVLEVTESGFLRAINPGTAVIAVVSGDLSGSATATVIPAPASCADTGIEHQSDVTEDDEWRAADGPHHILTTTRISARLRIGPGALLCFDGGAGFEVDRGTLLVEGTPEARVRMTSRSGSRWAGIRTRDPASGAEDPGTIRLRGVVLEQASRGIEAPSFSVDSAEFRGVGAPTALVVYGYGSGGGSLRNVLIEGGCGVIGVDSYKSIVLYDVTMRSSGCGGIYLSRRSGISLNNVRIEGAGEYGIWFSPLGGGFPQLHSVSNVRITGGSGYPARLSGAAALRLLEAVPVDSLLGNAKDTLIVYPEIDRDVTITARLPWVLDDAEVFAFRVSGTLTLEPGAYLGLATKGDLRFTNGGRLIAEGTPDAPVRIARVRNGAVSGYAGFHGPADTSRITHAVLDRVYLVAGSGHPLVIDSTQATGGAVWLGSEGSALLRSTIDAGATDDVPGRWQPITAALTLAAQGIRVVDTAIAGSGRHGVLVDAADALIEHCTITGSAEDGVHATGTAAGLVIHRSNLFGNAGFGVNNLSTTAVDATDNWWGDPEGPLGPEGDGVSGDVLFEPFRVEHAGR